MHPLLRSRLAAPIAIVSVAIWCAFALLVITIGPGPTVSPTARAPAIGKDVRIIPLTLADADVQLPVSTIKSDRLPRSAPTAPVEPAPVIKPAEAFDYAQAEAEKQVRRAHAEAPDLCERHGMRKVWTNRYAWRCRR
jgi:hypothetical protein